MTDAQLDALRMQPEGSPSRVSQRLKQLKRLPPAVTEQRGLGDMATALRSSPEGLSEEHAGNVHPWAVPQLSSPDGFLPGCVQDSEDSGGETMGNEHEGCGRAVQWETTRAQSNDSRHGSADGQKQDPSLPLASSSGPPEEPRPAARALRETEWRDNVTSVWPSDGQITGFLKGTLAQAQRKQQTVDPYGLSDIPRAAMAGAFAFTDGQ